MVETDASGYGAGSDAREGHARPSDFMAWCNLDKGYARQLTPWGSQTVVKPLGPLKDRPGTGQGYVWLERAGRNQICRKYRERTG